MAMKPLSSSQPAHESLDTTPADDVLNLLEQVESQFERIRALRKTQDDTVRSLTSRADELDAREAQMNTEQIEQQARHESIIERLQTQSDHQLDAIVVARNSLARRGRRVQHLEQVTQRAGIDRERLRRRLRGLRQAVRRLLKDGQRLQDAARIESEQCDNDQRTIALQNERLRLATDKMRHFSTLLMEQTERLERGSAAMMEVDALRHSLEESRKSQHELQEKLDSRVQESPQPRPSSDMDEHERRMQTRRNRLQHCRRLLQDRARRLPQMAQLEATRRRQESQMLEQQRHLDEVRQVLTATETRMIRKWAATRSTQIIGWAVLLTLLIACGSWWGANRFDPPVHRASVTLTAVSPAGTQLEPAMVDAWMKWHTELLTTMPFAERFAARLQERGVQGISSAESVRGFLSEGVTVKQDLPGHFVATTDMEHGVDWLDAMALVMATESARTVRSRPGQIVARVEGRHLEDGRVHYATYDSAALSDTRLRTAAVIFVASALLCLLLGLIIYAHLARVRHVLDDSLVDLQSAESH